MCGVIYVVLCERGVMCMRFEKWKLQFPKRGLNIMVIRVVPRLPFHCGSLGTGLVLYLEQEEVG